MYSPEIADFMCRVHERSGLSPCGTYLPASIHPSLTAEPKADLDTAREEARMVMFGAVAELLEKTGLAATDVDILVTNCRRARV